MPTRDPRHANRTVSARARWPAAVLLGAAAAGAQSRQATDWQLVASVRCSGGAVVSGSFDASGSRLVTCGEEGDLIEWDTRNGRLLRHCAAPGRDGRVFRHPRDPWAVVITGARTRQQEVHLLMLGDGSHRRLWQGSFGAAAFSDDGTRLALLAGPDEDCRRELLVYDEAAVLAGRLEQPLHRRPLCDGLCDGLRFTQGGSAVLVLDPPAAPLHVPLDGGAAVGPCSGAVPGLGAPEAPLGAEGIWLPEQVRGAWSAREVRGRLQRFGPRPCEWPLPDRECWYGAPVVAGDGTVAIGDGLGSLFVCGPAPGRHREVHGHAAVPLQLVFAADGGTLAIVGRLATQFLDCRDGTVCELPGASGVAAASGDGAGDGAGGRGFLLLRGRELCRWTRTRGAGPPMCSWSGAGPARALLWNWTGAVDPAPFARVARGRAQGLWIGAVRSEDEAWNGAAVIVDERTSGVAPVDCGSSRPDVYGRLRASAIAPVARGRRVLVAWRTPPIQCGTGLGKVRYRGALRLFDAAGRPVQQRWFRQSVRGLRVSPSGGVAVVLPQSIAVGTAALDTVGAARPEARWRDFAFAGNHTALATDGRRLVWVGVPRLRERAEVQLPGVDRMDLLALSPDGGLLAVASGGTVRLFRAAGARPRPWRSPGAGAGATVR